jgi:ankyrin repeat protein
MKGSFYSNSDITGVPLPSILKIHQEILSLIVSGATEGAKELIKKLKTTEIVKIRGLSITIEDISFEPDPVDTRMWNPLHFAVYFNNLDLSKFFLKEMKVNQALTLPKANSDNEKVVSNYDRYPEDKIVLLFLAYDRGSPEMLRFLLDECFRFWPFTAVE